MTRFSFILLFIQIPLLCKGTEYEMVTTLDLVPGRIEYILSPNYPFSMLDYSKGKQYAVAWIINAPIAHIIKIKALTFNMTRSTFCNADSLAISEDGDPEMYGARKFCGNVTALVSESKENKMKLEFIGSGVAYTNPESKFVLQVSAVPSPGFCTCGTVETFDTIKKYSKVQMDGSIEMPIKSVVAIFDIGIHRVFCSGSIISKKHVLTLAHCLDERFPHDVAVINGKYDLNEKGNGEEMYRASRFIIHHQYERETCLNDIALLVIEWEFRFGDLNSICLPYKFANVDLTGEMVSAIGYNIAFSQLGTMQDLYLTITNYFPTYPEGFMETRSYRESCTAESGGPIIHREYRFAYQDYDQRDGQIHRVQDAKFEYIVGMVSYRNFGKSNETGYDIKITPYLDWIWANSDRIPHCRY